jgi:hypothetical protein
MTFGINRVHGAATSPKNFAGVDLQDFTLTFWAGDAAVLAADQALAGGAIDQVFRTAVGTVASVSRIGTISSNTLRFAVESLGFDQANSGDGFLGTGPDNADAGVTTTAAALTAAIQALGTVTNSAGGVVHLTSATVAKFAY